MTDTATLSALRRPRILVQAARLGARDYRRERDLATALGSTPGRRQILPHLLAAEEALEAARRAADGTWSAARHISVLSALLAEAAATPMVSKAA